VTVPLWAYPAAFAGAFLAARAFRGGGAAPAADVVEAAVPTAQPTIGADASAGGDYGGYGGGGAYGLGDAGLGSIPYPVGSAPPPPAPVMPPAPTGTTYNRPTATPPAGAVGWMIVPANTPYFIAAKRPWDGKYPVTLQLWTYLSGGSVRWVSAPQDGKLQAGGTLRVRRVTPGNSNLWNNAWIPATGYAVYPASQASVLIPT
jgi:hypothetical protein